MCAVSFSSMHYYHTSFSSFFRIGPPPYLGRFRDPRLRTHPGISLVGRENTLPPGLAKLQLVSHLKATFRNNM